MFQWSTVVLAETTTCRSRGSACGLEGDREERSNKGLVEVLRTSMKTCGVCPRRPAAAAHCSVLERASGVSSSAEGTSSFGKVGALTCTGRKGAQAIGSRALTRPRAGRSGEVSEGSIRRSRLQPRKLRRSSIPTRAREREGGQSVGPKPATCRQARSCWRPDDRKVVRRRPRTKRRKRCFHPRSVSMSKSRRVSHGVSAGSLQR
jgi:hypothetical protein